MMSVTIPVHHRHRADILRPHHRSKVLRLSALQFPEEDQVFSVATFALAMDRCWLPELLTALILCYDSSRYHQPPLSFGFDSFQSPQLLFVPAQRHVRCCILSTNVFFSD